MSQMAELDLPTIAADVLAGVLAMMISLVSLWLWADDDDTRNRK
jgi:hypothetical protein